MTRCRLPPEGDPACSAQSDPTSQPTRLPSMTACSNPPNRGRSLPRQLIIELRTCELAIPKLEEGVVLRPQGDAQ